MDKSNIYIADSSADAEKSESALIEANTEELMTLRKSIEKLNKKIECRQNQSSKLFRSNNNIELIRDKLQREITDIEAKVSLNKMIDTTKKQEVKDFQNARANMSQKLWDNCLSEIGNYANHFSQWITEYRAEVLKEEIENYQKKCKKVQEELFIMKKELNDITVKYNFDYIVVNAEDINDIANLNSVMSTVKPSNNNLINLITLTKNTLKEMQKKIKQTKIVVNKYKTGKKVKKF